MTMSRRELPRSRGARSGRNRERIELLEDSPRRSQPRPCPPAPASTDFPPRHPPGSGDLGRGLQLLADRPDEAEQLTCDGDDGLVWQFPAVGESPKAPVQTILRLPSDGRDLFWLTDLPSAQAP